MIGVKFKNFKKTESLQNIVENKIGGVIEKFPELKSSRVSVLVEMENSRTQAGLDVFKIKLCVLNGAFKNLIIEKSDSNFYKALAEVSDSMLETFNRFGDKQRIKKRNQARNYVNELKKKFEKKWVAIINKN